MPLTNPIGFRGINVLTAALEKNSVDIYFLTR